MATRYSGEIKINVLYRDQGDYRAVVTDAKRNRWSGFIRPAPAGFGRDVAYDSPQAYDEIASSALSFADNDEDGWVAESAAFDREGQGWHVGRSLKDAWPR